MITDNGLNAKRIVYGRYCEKCRRRNEVRPENRPCDGCMIYATIEDDDWRRFENAQETKNLEVRPRQKPYLC